MTIRIGRRVLDALRSRYARSALGRYGAGLGTDDDGPWLVEPWIPGPRQDVADARSRTSDSAGAR